MKTNSTLPGSEGASSRCAPNIRKERILLLCLALLYVLGVWWGLPSAIAPASDSNAPLGPLSFVAEYRNPDKTYIYPAVHQLLLLPFYAVVLAVCKLAGLIGRVSSVWPYGMTDPSSVFSALILASNLVSLVMGLAVLDGLRRIRPAASYTPMAGIAVFALGGVFTYYARVPNMDVPYVFWLVLGFVCLWRFLFDASAGLRWLCISGVCSALAVGTKDQASGVVLGYGLVLLSLSPSGRDGSLRSRARHAAIFAAALLLAYALAAIAPQPQRWWRHVVFVTSDHVIPEFAASWRGQTLLLARSLLRLSHILSPVGVALAACGLFALFRDGRRRESVALLLPALAYYVSIIAKVRASEERYLLPIAWFCAVLIGVAVGTALTRSGPSRSAFSRVARLAVAVAVIHQFVWGFVPITWTQMFDLKRDLARDLPALVASGSPLLITGMVSFNLPNSRVYERYRLMHPPGDRLEPPSTHGEKLFHPYEPDWRFVLVGSPHPILTPKVPTDAVLVRAWAFPPWIKAHVHVPCVYEFSLFERRHP
jgi:hypothetical protein